MKIKVFDQKPQPYPEQQQEQTVYQQQQYTPPPQHVQQAPQPIPPQPAPQPQPVYQQPAPQYQQQYAPPQYQQPPQPNYYQQQPPYNDPDVPDPVPPYNGGRNSHENCVSRKQMATEVYQRQQKAIYVFIVAIVAYMLILATAPFFYISGGIVAGATILTVMQLYFMRRENAALKIKYKLR